VYAAKRGKTGLSTRSRPDARACRASSGPVNGVVGGTNPGVSGPLSGELAELETLSAGPDPNVRVSALADLPTSPISPRKSLTIVAAIVGGFVVGLGLVFLVQLINPKIQREEELRGRFRLPVLARVPRSGAKRWPGRGGPLVPGTISPEAKMRTLNLLSVISPTYLAKTSPAP